ncbi:MAG: PilZ domain-containing protein [Pseudomonadales bacterium]
MDQRRHPRIQLPLLVELKHPTTGVHRCIARDVSEGGVFVYTEKPQIKPGAKVKLTLQNTLSVESQPTPTVDMEVKRVDADGLALAFVNATGRHLWQSVERLRTELAIGQDYFQVHLNALVINDDNAILLAQQHGKWTFPATFLEVGQDWRAALEAFLARDLDVPVSGFGNVVAMNSVGYPELPEAAVIDLFVEAYSSARSCKPGKKSRYKTVRWTDRRRDIEEATFASEEIRELADAALMRRIKNEGPG